jgi:hypothetical protein
MTRTSAIYVLLACLSAACGSSDNPQGGTGGASAQGGSGGESTGGLTGTGGAGNGGVQTVGQGGAGTGGVVGTGGAPSGGTKGTGGVGTGGATGTGGSAGIASAGSGGGKTGGAAGTVTSTGGGIGGTGSGGQGTSSPGSGGTGTGGMGPRDAGAGSGGSTGGGSGSGGVAIGGNTGGGIASAEGPTCATTVSAAATKTNKKLPDPFAMHDGTRITSKAQWGCRRAEIKADLEKFEIGPKPAPPTVKATFSGGKLSVDVTTSSGTITLSSTVSGSGSCVVIGMNSSSSLVTGCTQVPFSHDQVVKYGSDSTQNQSDPFYKVYPDLWKKIGNYTAWSWGISRLIDGIEQVKDQMKVDPTKIAVHGCSYAGKMALFGGALDERVALTVAQESGGGGINSWRTSQDFVARTGTSIEKIDNTNYSWFLSSMKSLDPYSLPHDHHELIGMVAPRAIIILGNADYEWLGDESGYKSTMAAVEIFKAMGVPDSIGYDFTSGHKHCQAATSQTTSVKTFVDRFLKGTGTTSSVAIKPTSSKFELDYTKVIDWTTPTLQ